MERSELQRELNSLFDFNPPSLKWDNLDTENTTATLPLSFYDKHLSDNSKLKQVRLMPSLLGDIESCVDKALRYVEERKIDMPPVHAGLFVSESDREHMLINSPIHNADSIAQLYFNIAKCCSPVASVLLLYPSAQYWISSATWRRTYTPPPGGQSYVIEDGTLRLLHFFAPDGVIPDDWKDALDNKTIDTLRKTMEQFPDLATWQILPMTLESEGLLENMSELSKADYFDYETPTIAANAKHTLHIRPKTMDGTETPWTIPSNSSSTTAFPNNSTFSDGPWRSTRSRTASLAKTPRNNSRGTSPKNQTTISDLNTVSIQSSKQRAKSLPPDTVTLQRLVQHAWGESTRVDTSLIVFRSGNLERIGIRHRQSQTLYISDLIHVDTCKDPAYGKLHVGLYMAALADAMNRVALTTSDQPKKVTRTRSKKRPSDNKSSEGNVKRRRLTGSKGATTQEYQNQNVLGAAKRCKLALVYLDYGVYGSSNPASLFRLEPSIPPMRNLNPPLLPKTKRYYAPHEYISLVVGRNFGWGATGTIHDAKLELQTKDGQLLVHDVVVKLAFDPTQRQRLWYEYSVYHRLASKGVSGILTAVGVYESKEDGVSALVMTRGGTCLQFRDGGVKALSVSQKASFLKTMEEMHEAGVRHGDVRLMNLLVNDAGETAIIDFDRAKIDPPADKKEAEYEKLSDMLDGNRWESSCSP